LNNCNGRINDESRQAILGGVSEETKEDDDHNDEEDMYIHEESKSMMNDESLREVI